MSALRILVLGGTRFVGRHIADAFVAAGDAVTLFNRGISDPSPRADVVQITGDRSGGLSALDATWEAVIDTSGYTPGAVRHTAQFFAQRAARYLFVSSISVYDLSRVIAGRVNEDAPVLALPPDADSEVFNVENYGALKALCENEVRGAFGGRATIFRLGLVAGPLDPTDRFTYWVLRTAAGGEILTPPAERFIQYIDARDVAEFAVRAVHDDAGGTFNVVVPPQTYTFGELLAECARASGTHPVMRPRGEAFLLAHGVAPWSDLPLWIPQEHEAEPMLRATADRAIALGLHFRPLGRTVTDTFAWASDARRFGELKAGLSRETEQELLDASDA